MENQANYINRIASFLPHLEKEERLRRLYLSAEAMSMGRGGISAVSKLTGVSRATLTTGIKELKGKTDDVPKVGEGRQRRAGAGRPGATKTQPDIEKALLNLVDKDSYGNPQNPLTWTIKSLRTLANELVSEGYKISHRVVGELLKSLGFSLQQNKKLEQVGERHPDRNAQFEHINTRAKECAATGDPVISIDCKKKEIVGNYKNSGSEWHEAGLSPRTYDHEYLWERKAAPYGIYDMLENEGYVKVGISSDTAEFAVATIESWWHEIGQKRYPHSHRLYITADGGGSNGSRNRLWKKKLQEFANSNGIEVEVSHFPPGTSKWNKIEHCLFSQITRNWRGRPLETLSVIVNLISATTTKTGLTVKCSLDEKEYATGIKVSDEEFNAINIVKLDFHGEWNYIIKPQKC